MEEAEFEAFFRAMFPKLARYAQRRLDPDAAQDIAAAALKQVWIKDPATPADALDERRLQSLAYRIADGLVRNALRSARSRRELTDRLGTLPPDQLPDVADEVLDRDAIEWPGPLSLTDREVLNLLVDGYRVAEIAVILDCSPAAVSMRLHRAKRNVRRMVAREVKDR